MTQVKLLYKRIDGVTAGGVPITDGSVAYWPVRSRNTVGGLLTKVADNVPLGSTVTLDPDTYYFQLIDVSDGRGGVLSGEDAVTCRIVPASGTPLEIDDLEETNPSGLSSAEVDELKAYIDAKTAGIVGGTPTGTGPGGQFYSQDVKDTTATGRAVMTASGANTAAAQTAARAAIDAAKTAHNHPASDLTATGTKDGTKYLRDDNTWSALPAGAAASWPVAGTPTTFPPSTHSHAQSEVTGLVAALAALTAAVTTTGNNVVIPGATPTTPRNHPVTGAVLPAAPACCVTWTSVGQPTEPAALDPNGDIWLNKETP